MTERPEPFDLGQWLVTWLVCLPVALVVAAPYFVYNAFRDLGTSRVTSACTALATLLLAVLASLQGFWWYVLAQSVCSAISLAAIWHANRDHLESSVFTHEVS